MHCHCACFWVLKNVLPFSFPYFCKLFEIWLINRYSIAAKYQIKVNCFFIIRQQNSTLEFKFEIKNIVLFQCVPRFFYVSNLLINIWENNVKEKNVCHQVNQSCDCNFVLNVFTFYLYLYKEKKKDGKKETNEW